MPETQIGQTFEQFVFGQFYAVCRGARAGELPYGSVPGRAFPIGEDIVDRDGMPHPAASLLGSDDPNLPQAAHQPHQMADAGGFDAVVVGYQDQRPGCGRLFFFFQGLSFFQCLLHIFRSVQ